MKIAVYCRVSTEKEEQLDSLTQQKAFFSEYAAKHNYNLIRMYADEGVSGKQLKKRDQFLRMMSDARLGLFEMVAVKDISRFARNTVDFLTSIRQLKALGIGVQFVSGNMTSLGDSEFVLTIFSALAQEESANLSKRVKFGKNLNAQKGKVPNIVFGYNQIDKFTLAINEAEAEVVRTIFKMYLESGLGLEKIAQHLQENTPVRSKRTGKWTQAAIGRIIQNEIYTGVITNKKSEVVDFLTGKRRDFDESQWIKTQKPELAIISKEDYTRAQEIRLGRRYSFKINKERHSNLYPFSTLIKCEHCGYSYRRFYKEFKYGTYKKWSCSGYHLHICANTVKLDENELSEQIIEYLKSVIEDKNAFFKNALAVYQAQNIPIVDIKDGERLQRELDRLKKNKEKAVELFENEVITMDELKTKTAGINQEIGALKERLEKANEAEAKRKRKESLTEASTKTTFKSIEEIINQENLTNEMLKKIIEKITVNKDGEVKIYIRQLNGEQFCETPKAKACVHDAMSSLCKAGAALAQI